MMGLMIAGSDLGRKGGAAVAGVLEYTQNLELLDLSGSLYECVGACVYEAGDTMWFGACRVQIGCRRRGGCG